MGYVHYGINKHLYIRIQDLKNIKNVNECRDGMPKCSKQGRNDGIVKVNIQSLIPASFSHHCSIKRCRDWTL